MIRVAATDTCHWLPWLSFPVGGGECETIICSSIHGTHIQSHILDHLAIPAEIKGGEANEPIWRRNYGSDNGYLSDSKCTIDLTSAQTYL